MTYRNIFFSLLVGIFCCLPSYVVTGMMMPNMNMEDFEKELEEANRAIEEYVASLSPEEQDAFNKSVADMTQMFESMSDEEFEKFLGEMFAEEPMMMEPNPFDAIQQVPMPEEQPQIILSAEDKKKAEVALAVLDDIIKQSNTFMIIVNSSSDLPGRINQWAKKNAIPHWQSGVEWTSFKMEIETFIQKLYRAEEQDLTTKKYKYLFELIADEALYNNLIQLRTELNTIIPKIEIPEFSIQKMSSQSKQAIKNVLGKYTESFYLLDIPKALDTLFEKYAPEEEKIRAAEEAATKKAQEAARMTRTPAAKTEAGAESMGYGEYYGGYEYPYGYESPYGYDYGYPSEYGYPSYGTSEYGAGAGKGGGSEGAGGGSRSGDKAGATEKEEEEEEKEKKKKEKEKTEKFTPQYEIENAIVSIKKDLEDIKTTMFESEEEEKPTKLEQLVANIKGDEKIDETLAGYILPRVVDKKLSDIDLALKKIDAKKLNPDDLAHYQKVIGKLFDDYKKDLDMLITTIDSFEQKTEEEKEAAKKALATKTSEKEAEEEGKKKIDIETLPIEKQWAYFGGKESELPEEDAQLKETITPVSLFTIRDTIKKLFDDVKKFETKKAEVPRKPIQKKESTFDVIPPIPAAPGE